MVSMRILAALGVGLSAITGSAQASSIVVLGASTATPSIIRLGAADPMKIGSTPSVVALGEPAPDITDEKVSAIPEKPTHHGSMQSPMIIRGGVVGGAFATPAAVPAKATATAPATETKPAEDGKPAGEATASNGEPKSQPEAQQPQPAAAQPAPISPIGKAM
ncbi:hypothetical protein RFN25_22690 [Mesorhizobium abyssinicae]|uniref:hypothetical protein n=1 Tax=Mesorhizobium TaxID=68287 RepID=UPI0025C41EB6|nr:MULTISPECIES: hypothetical protein [Mesorhizobium]MDX8436233.1 hypothetical protein [Mesorhizobium abyssinicae]